MDLFRYDSTHHSFLSRANLAEDKGQNLAGAFPAVFDFGICDLRHTEHTPAIWFFSGSPYFYTFTSVYSRMGAPGFCDDFLPLLCNSFQVQLVAISTKKELPGLQYVYARSFEERKAFDFMAAGVGMYT